MLIVLSIMALLAALAVPALKNFGHADAMTAADQQMLNDVARARQLAISQRSTVYMVFVPAAFWNNNLSAALQALPATTNLCDKQLTGYTFAALGAVGDQPGNHQWHYLAPWQSLPDGTFIAQPKFYFPGSPPLYIPAYNPAVPIYVFDQTNSIPFPAETNTPALGSPFYLPYIAFNYLGQLTDDGQNVAPNHEYIPLARGSMLPAVDPATKTFQLRPPQVYEAPLGNSTNAYNLIDIDPLTGRATLREPKLQ
jgi:type II secretory pathway pseudopilin PulG